MPRLNRLTAGSTLVALLAYGAQARAEPRTHDGFQFRGGLGVGYLSADFSADVGSISLSGGAGALDLFFGGSLRPGMTVGGFLFGANAVGPQFSYNGQSGSASNASLLLYEAGAYFDWYPNPTGGFHLQPMIGVAATGISYTDPNSGQQTSGSDKGLGLGAGVGYDFWVGDEWSLGVLGQFTYATPDSAIAPMVLASLVYQ